VVAPSQPAGFLAPTSDVLLVSDVDDASTDLDAAEASVDYDLALARQALERIRGAEPTDNPLQPPGTGPTGLLTASVQVGEIADSEAVDPAGGSADGVGPEAPAAVESATASESQVDDDDDRSAVDLNECIDEDDEDCEER
jgi:hypothetical protein